MNEILHSVVGGPEYSILHKAQYGLIGEGDEEEKGDSIREYSDGWRQKLNQTERTHVGLREMKATLQRSG